MEKKVETNVTKPEFSFFENEVDYFILKPESETLLDSRIKNIEDYIKNNSGKGKSEEEKDSIYQEAQNLWKCLFEDFKETRYNFYLNRPQYRFLTDLIISKLEYDVNTVFFVIELTDMLGTMKESKFSNDTDLIPFLVNATEITYIYHLISKHKVKGLTKDAYIFSQILYKIGGISKIINYYEALGKNLSEDIKNWVLTFEEGVTFDKINDSQKSQDAEIETKD